MTPTTALASPQIQLMEHQKPAKEFIKNHPYAGIWLGMGFGKTLSVLSALQEIRPQGHTLVIAPINIARSTWLDEIQQWQMPVRTRSLIVDEQDKPLTKDQRLQRFRDVFTDPPTMYFINHDLLTQPSNRENLLERDRSVAPGTDLSDMAIKMLALLSNIEPVSVDALLSQYRELTMLATGASKPPAMTHVRRALKELRGAGLVRRVTRECRFCQGEGCAECRYGLVDQMPIEDRNGQRTLVWPFQTVIIDESQSFKSHSAQRFKALAMARPAISRLVELTGTPAPNGLEDLWSQVYLLDQGEALGKNITTFRKRWFTPKMVPGTNTPAKWIPNPGADEEIYQAISHLVMSAKNTSLSLPPVTIQDAFVTLPKDIAEAYKAFKRDLVIDVVNTAVQRDALILYDTWFHSSTDDEAQDLRGALSALTGSDYDEAYEQARDARIASFTPQITDRLVSTVVAENKAVLTSKLLQFASGTLYTSDPDDPSTKGQYEVLHDEKIQMAQYIIRNTGGSPVLMAYHFRSDRTELLEKLNAAGITAEAFDGSRAMIHRWNAGQIPVMLIHPASAGHGLNLQHGGYTMIWYSLSFNLEHYLQTNARLHRTGQKHPVTIYRIITRGTHDERLPLILDEKKVVQDDLIAAVDIENALTEALEEEFLDDLNDLWYSTRL